MTGKKQVQKIDLNFVFRQVKSNKFISIFVLTGKIQQIYLNSCSDVQCLKSQTFSNSCAQNRHDFLAKIVEHIDGTSGAERGC